MADCCRGGDTERANLMMSRGFSVVAAAGCLLLGLLVSASIQSEAQSVVPNLDGGHLFSTSDSCLACHNGLSTTSGEDISIGFNWRASMMANAARDPYWHAAVRREITDHPQVQTAIEHECSKCHMPMAQYEANLGGRQNGVFEHLPIGTAGDEAGLLAADGVSCTVCHQISEENLGTEESLVGGFLIDASAVNGERAIYGPFDVDDGRMALMRSATGFRQTESTHIQDSELCATCHTLITEARGPNGEVVGELPEQVPYQEWLHSSYREERSCQDCHMPAVQEETAVSSVLGKPREGMGRHDFRGSNFFVIQMLNRHRDELGVEALPQELDLAARKAADHLGTDTARIAMENGIVENGRLRVEVLIESLAGHKLPTAYPSRRVWIEFAVKDGGGEVIFQSGRLAPTGAIDGNDNDADPARFEPHHEEITRSDQVQIYESILLDLNDAVTTGLLNGVRYAKDNRVLPNGFDKTTADERVAVHGSAFEDPDFRAGSDRVLYTIDVGGAQGPFTLDATLWYQSIGYRWAENLRPYDAPEPRRFVSYYEAMSEASGVALARSSLTLE